MYYKHKETGATILYEEVIKRGRDLGCISLHVMGSKVQPDWTIRDPYEEFQNINTWTYKCKDIPFSDDWVLVSTEIDLSVAETYEILNCIGETHFEIPHYIIEKKLEESLFNKREYKLSWKVES